MPTLITNYNWGASLRNENPELTRQLSDAYISTAVVVNTKSTVYSVNGANPPASSDFNQNFSIGDMYVRIDTNTAWIMTSRTTSRDVTWTQIT